MGFAALTPEYYTRWYNAEDSEAMMLTDETILFTWELLDNAGFLRTIFYDRVLSPSPDEYLDWAKNTNKLFFVVFCTDGTPCGLCWLTDPSVTGHQSYGHFSTLGIVPIKVAADSGRELLKFIGKITKVKQVIGITPAVLKGAVAFALSMGFKKLAKLEKMLWCLGKERDAILTICELKEL